MGSEGSAGCAFARACSDSLRRTWRAWFNSQRSHAAVDLVARSVCGDTRVVCVCVCVCVCVYERRLQPTSPRPFDKMRCDYSRSTHHCVAVAT